MANVLNANYFNIGNWTKNMTSFPTFSNSYANGVNTLTYMGGAAYERIYIPVEVEPFWEYTFRFSFHSPSGFTMGDYGVDEAFAFVCANAPSDTDGALTRSLLGRTKGFDTAASSTAKQYEVRFNPGKLSTVYLAIDFGYIIDGVVATFVFSDFSLDNGIADGDLEKQYAIGWKTAKQIAVSTRRLTRSTEDMTMEDVINALNGSADNIGIYYIGTAASAWNIAGTIFNSTASGAISL